MKKIISMVLVFTMLASTVNVSFAAEVEQGDITSYDASAASDITSIDFALTNKEKMTTFDYADDENISCIPSKPNLLPENLNEPIKATDIEMVEGVEAISDVSSVNTTTINS